MRQCFGEYQNPNQSKCYFSRMNDNNPHHRGFFSLIIFFTHPIKMNLPKPLSKCLRLWDFWFKILEVTKKRFARGRLKETFGARWSSLMIWCTVLFEGFPLTIVDFWWISSEKTVTRWWFRHDFPPVLVGHGLCLPKDCHLFQGYVHNRQGW